MDYSNIISDFTWSYSRIGKFEQCPYAFLMRYIMKTPHKRLFFSDYGLFMHKLIERRLNGELTNSEMVSEYLLNFRNEVRAYAPSKSIFKSYFYQGLQYLNNFNFPYSKILGVEQEVEFYIEGIKFTGVIDCIAEDGTEVVLVDNKSRALKPRSNRKKPTVADGELDTYLRQLYLYSIAIKDKFHKYPARLEFNCFRTGQLISEPFREEELEKAKDWAIQSIKQITRNEDWSPSMDYWKCRYLCDLRDSCEYFKMSK